MAVTYLDIGISLDQLLNSLLVKNADGTFGIRTILVAKDNQVPARDCVGTNLTLEQIARYAIQPDEDGNPALVLITGA